MMTSADSTFDPAVEGPVLSVSERRAAGIQLFLAMTAVGLLVLAVIWRFAVPSGGDVANLIAGVASLLVAVPVLVSAWHSLRHPSLHGVTDQLIALALIAAWASGDLMTAAILPIVMIIGHVLEERSLLGSQEAIRALGALTRTGALRLRSDGEVEAVESTQLRAGDHIEVRPGDRIAADGVVMDGLSNVDTAPVTGEALPQEVLAGSRVFAGSINLDGLLRVEVTEAGLDSTLGKIIVLMQEAERAKPPVTRLLERYANAYIVLVLLLAAGTWFLSGDSQAMLAVLVAACPCALVIAAPATAIAGIAVAARHGILVKGSAFLEELSDTNMLIVDKTGTVTLGELHLLGCRPASGVDEADLFLTAASLARASNHPVSRAVARLLGARAPLTIVEPREQKGFGVVAQTERGVAALGRPELFAEIGVAFSAPPEHNGPIAGVSLGGRFLGWLLLADMQRPEAAEAIKDLAHIGLARQLLLTGDRLIVAEDVAARIGISEVQANALPEDKLNRVIEEIHRGFRPLVVGDGINDALALKAGAVGVAAGAAHTDVALASADIVLMNGDLRRLGTAIRLSRHCRKTIQVNVAIGLGWTCVIVVFAAFGLLGVAGAVVAAILHNISTLVVMANAGRLLRFHEPLASS